MYSEWRERGGDRVVKNKYSRLSTLYPMEKRAIIVEFDS
jgi:hypothetical protein